MIREHVEEKKLLKLRLEQQARWLEKSKEDIEHQAKRYEALLDAQRIVIERLMSQKS